MDCSTADVPSIVVHDSPVSDDSSDDKPLIKRKTIAASPKKTKTKDDTSLKSNGTNTKKADLNRDDSSDNEPLIKITKMSSKAAKKISVDSKQQESLEEDNSSDDEPLSELREKLHPQRQRKSPGGPSRKAAPLMKSKRNAARKKVKYTESSSDSSDDEALATMKRKLTKTPKEQKTSANSKQTKPKRIDKSPEGDGSSCSDDDVPLSKLLIRPCSEEKQSHEDTHSSISVSKKHRSASDDSSDDEPLIKKKTISASPKKTEAKDDISLKSNGTNTKKADLNSDDSSDNEPLVKITKMSSKAAERKSVDLKQKESLEEDNSSDDEPLSELCEKLHPQRQRKSPGGPSRKATPLMKSKRNAARKKVKYTESSSDSSDDEALATMKRKLTKTPKEQKTSANSKQTKPKRIDKSPEGDGSSCSDDDVPLSKLLIRPCSEEKQSHEDTHSSISVSKKHRSASDDSSDDEPLIKKKTISASPKKTKTKDDMSLKSNGTNTKKTESLEEDNSSDDEPLSELREKLPPQRQRKSPGGPSRKATPLMKSKRNAARKKVKYTESLSDSSDDEALATMKRKLTKTPKEQKTSANSKQTKPKQSLDEDNSSDDEPLSELKKKLNPQRQRKSPGGPSRKAAPVMKSKGNAARKKDSSSDDDVPLVNLIAKRKKPMKKNTKTTTASRSRASRKRRVSSGNISDDEPLIKAARHPQVTKLLRIILRRCDGEEGVDTGTGSLNKSGAATTIEEKTLKEESEGSEESPEEE
ncbi:hypothetical protein ABVT39_003517 [Epinephelus coioides]